MEDTSVSDMMSVRSVITVSNTIVDLSIDSRTDHTQSRFFMVPTMQVQNSIFMSLVRHDISMVNALFTIHLRRCIYIVEAPPKLPSLTNVVVLSFNID